MTHILRWLAVLITLCFGSAAAAQEGKAEVPRGLWETGPDALGVVLHVRTRRCGRALCGRVERAKNRRGYDAPSSAVGEKVLWSLKPQPDGSFLGEYRDTDANIFALTRVQVQGKNLNIDACTAEACKELVWKRLR